MKKYLINKDGFLNWNLPLLLMVLSSLDLRAQYVPGVSYFGVHNYIEYIAGDMPIIFVAPHAGGLEPIILPDIYTRGPDNGTMDLARFMADSLHFKSNGRRPHIIINHLRPSKLNPAISDSTGAAGTHPIALQAFHDFHNFIQIAHNKVTTDWGKGHYFELHGNGANEAWNMVGLGVSKTYLSMPDSVLNRRVHFSTVKNLCTVGGANFLEIIRGATSLGGLLSTLGWKSTPSPAYPAPADTVTFFYAGENTWQYGSRHSGTIDATHLESYWQFMVLSAHKSKYSNDLANAILHFMALHYGFHFSGTLPVELLGFTVQLQEKNHAWIQWKVGSERNVSAYQLERSMDAKTFDLVELIKAQQQVFYHFTDKNLANGNYYYRLKMVNKDGSFQYSPITSLVIMSGQAILIYNNPAQDVLRIESDDVLVERNIELYSLEGKLLDKKTLKPGMTMCRFNVQILSAGTYLVRIFNGQVHKTIKVVVNH
jgi:Secretion system C-terminal sorting domain